MKKICVITGTRAEYGLLYWVMKKIQDDDNLELHIIATGMHLSPEFGLTYKQIEDDGFKIIKKIDVLLSSDTPVGISKSMGLGMISFSESYEELNPDLILVLGDRFEIFSAVSAAMVSRIPVAHCHGGEATEGLIDESIRHSITKMSHIHFTSTEEYKKRVVQLGEQPKNVHNVGALGIENIKKLSLLSKSEFEKSINFKLDAKFTLIVTFHPVTLEKSTAESQVNSLLEALGEISNLKIIFTLANSDTDGRIINEKINNFVSIHSKQCVVFKSLGQLRYLSALKHVDVVVGNSSSGLIEAPSFKVATVNIGDRQKGRILAESVINCGIQKEAIKDSILKAICPDFKNKLKTITNPYEKGNSSEEIINVIKNTPLNGILKKNFYDLE